VTNWVPCETCAGTGQVEKPSMREKIARHLIFAAANQEKGPFGLGLSPDEVHELGIELGILAPGTPAPSASPIPFPTGAVPLEAEPARPAAPPVPMPAFDAFAPAAAAEPEPDDDEPAPYFPPEPSRPNGVREGLAPELPGHVKISPLDAEWRPTSGHDVSAPGIPGPAVPGAPGAPGVSLTGPPGGV
jgi:hypothetical protein